jgi:methionine synthase I (cobalamin-dependent)
MRTAITESLKNGNTLISDGARGTFLQQRGLTAGECPEWWCIDFSTGINLTAGICRSVF